MTARLNFRSGMAPFILEWGACYGGCKKISCQQSPICLRKVFPWTLLAPSVIVLVRLHTISFLNFYLWRNFSSPLFFAIEPLVNLDLQGWFQSILACGDMFHTQMIWWAIQEIWNAQNLLLYQQKHANPCTLAEKAMDALLNSTEGTLPFPCLKNFWWNLLTLLIKRMLWSLLLMLPFLRMDLCHVDAFSEITIGNSFLLQATKMILSWIRYWLR